MKRLAGLIIMGLLATALPASAQNVGSNVTVEVSPNSELLGVLYYLAFGNDTFVIDRGDYIKEVEAYFGKYRDLDAVALVRDYFSGANTIPERDYRLMILEYYLLLCSEPPELKPLTELGYLWFEDVFLPAVRKFAEETNFMEFYRTHQDCYQEDLRIYKGALSRLPPDEFMAKTTGISGVRYLFLHPYLVAVHGHSFNPELNGTLYWGAGGMMPLVRRTPQRTVWSYKTAKDTMFGLPLNRDIINSTYLDELIYLGFIYHELGHDITLPALYSLNLTEYEYLQDAIEDDMPYLARYDIHFWDSVGMIYEGFADAWEDYALAQLDENYTLLAMYMQKAWGEFWVEELFYRMQDCVGKVRLMEVPNLTACIPWALESLKKFVSPENASLVYENEVPVTPLRAFDRAAQAGKIIIVYGTQNPDENGTEYDRETAEMIAENLRKFYSQWPGGVDVVIKADSEVTDDDLRENLVLVGGPVANALVREFEEEFPFRFVNVNGDWKLAYGCVKYSDCPYNVEFFTITNESVKGIAYLLTDNASVILTVRNPYNPENYVTWIAGENRELTRLYTNPTYYLSSYEVYNGKEIQIGFYVQPLPS